MRSPVHPTARDPRSIRNLLLVPAVEVRERGARSQARKPVHFSAISGDSRIVAKSFRPIASHSRREAVMSSSADILLSLPSKSRAVERSPRLIRPGSADGPNLNRQKRWRSRFVQVYAQHRVLALSQSSISGVPLERAGDR